MLYSVIKVILTVVHISTSFQVMCIKEETKMPVQTHCERCGYISSNKLCKACILLEGLNKGLPKLGIGKTPKTYRTEGVSNSSESGSCTNCACKSKTKTGTRNGALNSVVSGRAGITASQDLNETSNPPVDNSNIDF